MNPQHRHLGMIIPVYVFCLLILVNFFSLTKKCLICTKEKKKKKKKTIILIRLLSGN